MGHCYLCKAEKPRNPVRNGWKIFDITEKQGSKTRRHVLSFCPNHSRDEIWEVVLEKVPPVGVVS